MTSRGAVRPGHGGGGDERVGVGDVRRQALHLQGGALLGHLAGVAAGALEGVQLQVDGLGAHRADLLRGRGAHVVRLDDRAEPLGRRDRLQAGDAGAEDDDLGGLDGAGRGHVEREEAAQHPGGDDRAAVAGDQGLRGQGVHRLGAGDARHQLHRERRRADVAQVGDEAALLVDRQERDRGGAAAQAADRVGGERLHREHHVGRADRVVGDRGTGLDELLVRDERVLAGVRLDRDLVAERGQLPDQLGHHRDPGLAVPGLLGHCDPHAADPTDLSGW